MADGTQLQAGAGGDLIRDVTRATVTTPGASSSAGYQQANTTQKTQVIALDIGGASGNGELLIDGGQALAAQSLPVVLASEQDLPSSRASAFLLANLLRVQMAGPTGFVPVEIPDWMVGF